jgi:iron complex outermembrane recepter protein
MANRKIAHAVRVALMTAGAASAGLYGGIAAAQQPLEEIVVTGTRIRDANLIASSPIATIDQDAFRFSGSTRVEDLLNTFPQLAPGFDAFTVNPTTGFATANLRGLGSFRTLVLVNGHRLQPGGIRSEARDLNQIPAALVKRVEVLTGGASAVYGSDAMAGVVNFILDTDFEGVSVSLGASGYQHDNDNEYLRPLMDARGFDYPDGNRGPDGRAYNVDLAIGSSFADGRGHAMAYATWRKNRELRQGARDYSSCALNAAGTVCGGSSTSPQPSFFVGQGVNFAHIQADGTWARGTAPLYNYAPINHYQRPDERWTFGNSVRYEVNRHFRPFVETMFSNTNTAVQIAESGTFFVNALTFNDGDPLIGSLYSDLGLNPALPVTVQAGKRNNEGGPRISEIESNSFRIVTGIDGDITDNWAYQASYLYGRNSSNEANVNDFLADRVGEALLGCPPGSFSGCVLYNVWEPDGVTAEQAEALSGVGMRTGATALTVLSGFVSGGVPFNFPTAQDPVSLVAGVEYRKDEYDVRTDSNMESGNFTGLGGPRLPVSGDFDVKEVYFEAGVPVFQGGDVLQNMSFDLGYRYSDYSTSGGVNSYKIGFSAQVTDLVRFRGGYNRAIRAPNVTELFRDQQISLWGGEDPCAGPTPSLTLAQCANTGVTAAQYGNIAASPAAQYNQHSGGNPDLEPEEADTWTVGFVATPIDNLQISLDYFQVDISDRIGTIGANNVLRFCALTGDPFLCNKVNRAPVTGDLWVGSDLATSGHVENLDANFGNLKTEGIDLVAQYRMDVAGGTLSTSLVGTYALKQEWDNLPGINPDAIYDCAGVINIACQIPDWRHTLRVSYARDWYTVVARWRYIGGLDYENQDGTPGTTDRILARTPTLAAPIAVLGGSLGSYSYLDLSGSVDVMDNITVTLGVNNVLDKEPPMVGADLAFNANAPQGYDQLGRFMFANVNVRF